MPAAVERLQDLAVSRGGFNAGLVQLLNDQIGLRFSIAVQRDYLALLALFQLLDAGLQEKRLAASFFAHDDEAVVRPQPPRYDVYVLFDLFGRVNALDAGELVVFVLCDLSAVDPQR